MIAQADAIRIPLPDKSIHCCVSSPPYWGLRKYAGDQGRIWGGDPECEHEWGHSLKMTTGNTPSKKSTLGGGRSGAGETVASQGQVCQLCDAWYGSLGLEPTPEQHVENIAEVFREVRRVLRDDGVVWLNYGDCYGHGTESRRPQGNTRGISDKTSEAQNINRHGGSAGNLMMMPHRVALALQQDGWIVRQDLVWYKRNPMPESINGTRWVKHRIKEGRSKHATDHNIKGGTEAMLRDASIHTGIDEDWIPKYVDCPGCEKCIPNDGLVLKRGSWRHTRAPEYVFMLTKKMGYWSNQEAVRESQGIAGVVEGSNFFSQGHHFINNFGLENTSVGASEICIRLAAALADFCQRNDDLGLSALDAEIRQKFADSIRSFPAIDKPTIHQVSIISSECSVGNASPKSFLEQINGLGFHLRYVDLSGDSGGLAFTKEYAGVVNPNGDTAIGVDDAGAVSQGFFDGHGLIIQPSDEREWAGSYEEQGSISQGDENRTGKSTRRYSPMGGRNPRSVLDIPTAPYRGAHYATFPPNLIAPLIRATCPRWACPVCGQGWTAVVEQQYTNWADGNANAKRKGGAFPDDRKALERRAELQSNVLGYRPTCEHPHTQEEAVPGIVFDPFVGSGTTIAVAKELLRTGIGIDISMEYLDQQAKVRAGLGTPSNALEDLPLFALSQ